MRDIARLVGLSQAAVSLALRNHPRVPEATRQRVREVAARLGYRADPRVAELMHHLRDLRRGSYRETIAYVVDEAARPLCGEGFTFGRQAASVKRQAQRLGYAVDTFWLGHEGLNGARLGAMLASRGIRGLVVGPMMRPEAFAGFDWARFVSVALNHTFAQHALHRVASHQLETMSCVLKECVERGYKRIGLVISRRHDLRVRRAWTTAYAGFFSHRPEFPALPVFWGETEEGLPGRRDAAFLEWFRAQRVEVLVTLVLDWVDVLADAGLHCPRDYACALLDKEPLRQYSRFAGIDQHHELIGEMAVNQLVGALYVGAFGVPKHAYVTLLEGSWVDGDTLPACVRRSKTGCVAREREPASRQSRRLKLM